MADDGSGFVTADMDVTKVASTTDEVMAQDAATPDKAVDEVSSPRRMLVRTMSYQTTINWVEKDHQQGAQVSKYLLFLFF